MDPLADLTLTEEQTTWSEEIDDFIMHYKQNHK